MPRPWVSGIRAPTHAFCDQHNAILDVLGCICRASIPADFKLVQIEDSTSASAFMFKPTEGTLEVGEAKTIQVQLQSDLLGDFSTKFQWDLAGSPTLLDLQFKGSIVGPKFKASWP